MSAARQRNTCVRSWTPVPENGHSRVAKVFVEVRPRFRRIRDGSSANRKLADYFSVIRHSADEKRRLPVVKDTTTGLINRRGKIGCSLPDSEVRERTE